MHLDLLIKALGWASVINYSILMVWFLMLVFARNFIYQLHNRWFNISSDRYDAIHFTLMGAYKLAIMLFFVVPYIALRIAA